MPKFDSSKILKAWREVYGNIPPHKVLGVNEWTEYLSWVRGDAPKPDWFGKPLEETLGFELSDEESLHQELIEAYQVWSLDQGYSPNTVTRELKILRDLLSSMEVAGIPPEGLVEEGLFQKTMGLLQGKDKSKYRYVLRKLREATYFWIQETYREMLEAFHYWSSKRGYSEEVVQEALERLPLYYRALIRSGRPWQFLEGQYLPKELRVLIKSFEDRDYQKHLNLIREFLRELAYRANNGEGLMGKIA